MTDFQLDSRLRQDCFIIGEWSGSLLLLLNNSLVPWFILVPETDVQELYQLPDDQQTCLHAQVSKLSAFLKETQSVDKLNIAAIGNIVSQLHVHVIGRSRGDFCWPGVVWGAKENQPYDETERLLLTGQIIKYIGSDIQEVKNEREFNHDK